MKIFQFYWGTHSWDVCFRLVLAETKEQAQEILKKDPESATKEWELEAVYELDESKVIFYYSQGL